MSASPPPSEISTLPLLGSPRYFPSFDGTKLAGTLYSAKASVANALIIHGYGEHGGRYSELVRELNQLGCNAMHFDLRGHGKSAGARGYIASFKEYLQDVEAALHVLQEHSSEVPTLIVGHSNGALIALHLLADPFRCPKSVAAVIVSSPFLALKESPRHKIAFARAASALIPHLALPNRFPADWLTRDREKQRQYENDPLCHGVVSARWFTETRRAQRWVAEFAFRIAVPTLYLVSGDDRVADPKVSQRIYESLSCESYYYEFPEMCHEIFNERDRENVFAIIRKFCATRFGQSSDPKR